jgi:hypothetical protein
MQAAQPQQCSANDNVWNNNNKETRLLQIKGRYASEHLKF